MVLPNGEPPSGQLIGRVLDGRFRVDELLGAGGMGAVYGGEQLSVGRAVAIKVLPPAAAADAAAVKRFFREGRLSSRLRHPNVVTTHDFGQTRDGLLYLVMERVDGEPLHELIGNEGPLPPRRALDLARQVASALGEAHARGVVHRDLKPANIMVEHRFGQRDLARVLDFGLARSLDPERSAAGPTESGQICGTPAYMSPEQVQGYPLSGKTDIYSLGCVLFFMLTGRAPFAGPGPTMMMAHLTEDFPRVDGADSRLNQVLADLAARDPDDRPGISAVVRALAAAVESAPMDRVPVVGPPSPGDSAVFAQTLQRRPPPAPPSNGPVAPSPAARIGNRGRWLFLLGLASGLLGAIWWHQSDLRGLAPMAPELRADAEAQAVARAAALTVRLPAPTPLPTNEPSAIPDPAASQVLIRRAASEGRALRRAPTPAAPGSPAPRARGSRKRATAPARVRAQ